MSNERGRLMWRGRGWGVLISELTLQDLVQSADIFLESKCKNSHPIMTKYMYLFSILCCI